MTFINMTDFNATVEMQSAGLGLAAFLNAITSPLGAFLIMLGVIGALIYILKKLGFKIGKSF